MLERSRARILEMLAADDQVLDVGGGAKPFARADWVIDVMPYEDRGLYGPAPDPGAERYGPATWVRRDICDRTPWPFADRQFDLSICSHTLEDVRDPVFVCSELIRVSKAGYIEVPSRLEEQAWGVHGPWVGWSHHRWLVDVAAEEITFVSKPHVIHARSSDHFQHDFWAGLDREQRVQCLWWRDRFRYRERVFTDAPSLDAYLSGFVTEHGPAGGRHPLRALVARVRGAR
jgi:hypothetical protein